jgi:uncharacterized membrane protein YjjB (DUF3815 family)
MHQTAGYRLYVCSVLAWVSGLLLLLYPSQVFVGMQLRLQLFVIGFCFATTFVAIIISKLKSASNCVVSVWSLVMLIPSLVLCLATVAFVLVKYLGFGNSLLTLALWTSLIVLSRDTGMTCFNPTARSHHFRRLVTIFAFAGAIFMAMIASLQGPPISVVVLYLCMTWVLIGSIIQILVNWLQEERDKKLAKADGAGRG